MQNHAMEALEKNKSKQAFTITMTRLDENKPLKNAFKRSTAFSYLFKFYSTLIIIFLKNNLTNICCEISKIGMNLWMVYIYI